MGLFWSLQPEPGSRPGIRLRKKDVTQPHSITLSIIAGHVDANHSSHHKSDILAQTEVKRCYMWEDVLRVPVRHGRIRGTLFIPQSKCIIKKTCTFFLLPVWWNETNKFNVMMLRCRIYTRPLPVPSWQPRVKYSQLSKLSVFWLPPD